MVSSNRHVTAPVAHILYNILLLQCFVDYIIFLSDYMMYKDDDICVNCWVIVGEGV